MQPWFKALIARRKARAALGETRKVNIWGVDPERWAAIQRWHEREIKREESYYALDPGLPDID